MGVNFLFLIHCFLILCLAFSPSDWNFLLHALMVGLISPTVHACEGSLWLCMLFFSPPVLFQQRIEADLELWPKTIS